MGHVLNVTARSYLVRHDFWTQHDQGLRQSEMINFAKNLALLGAALALMGVEEPWEASVPIAQPSKAEHVWRSVRERIAA